MHPDGIILESKLMHMPTQNSSAISSQIQLAAHQDDLPARQGWAIPWYYWLHSDSAKRQRLLFSFVQLGNTLHSIC